MKSVRLPSTISRSKIPKKNYIGYNSTDLFMTADKTIYISTAEAKNLNFFVRFATEYSNKDVRLEFKVKIYDNEKELNVLINEAPFYEELPVKQTFVIGGSDSEYQLPEP
jgi:hypothetical protein